MTQNTLTPATLDPATTDGTELAAWLEAWKQNVQSSHRGAAAPSYVVTGMIWAKSISSSQEELYYYDGAGSILLGQFNPTTHARAEQLMVPVMASQMKPAITNGAQAATGETTTNKVGYPHLAFDTATKEFAVFAVAMPSGWNEGTLTFRPHWTAASGSGGVTWSLQALARSDGDAIDTAYGTAVNSADTLLAALQEHRGPASGAITVGGSPATSDIVYFRVAREVADANDTLTVDALLQGIELFLTFDSIVDA